MLIETLGKKHVREILDLLNFHERIYFGEICEHVAINKGNLSKILNLLVNLGILKKEEEEEGKKLNKTYYSLTDFGKEAYSLYNVEKEIERKYSFE